MTRKIRPLVGERVAARVAQHVRVDVAKAGATADLEEKIVDGLPRELAAAFGEEQPGGCVGSGGEVALEGAHAFAVDRVRHGEAIRKAFEIAHCKVMSNARGYYRHEHDEKTFNPDMSFEVEHQAAELEEALDNDF